MESYDAQGSSSSEDDSIPSIERAIQLALTAPFAIGARLVDSAPAGIDKARQQIVLARFIGKLAVDRGTREVRDRLAANAAPISQTEPAISEPDMTVSPEDKTGPAAGIDLPGAETLALPDYDQLRAAHVIAKLPSLSEDEREAIEKYEMARRHRRTVLGKLSQLRSDQASV